jgi:hypothetical protein
VYVYIAWLALKTNDTLLLYQIPLADLFKKEEFALAMDMTINYTRYSLDLVSRTLVRPSIFALARWISSASLLLSEHM